MAADGDASGTADTADYVLWRKAAGSPLTQTIAVAGASVVEPPVESQVIVTENLTTSSVLVATPTTGSVLPVQRARVWRSAALTITERHRDDALVSLLSSFSSWRHRKVDREMVSGADDPPTELVHASLQVALETIFAPGAF